MSKIRLLMLLLTFFVVGTVATVFSLYARGYRFNAEKATVTPNGLLVLKSNPDSAQVHINGKLKTATAATIPLPPGTYDITVKKEGFKDWSKRLEIEKEIVTEATAHLFKSAPSLTAITFTSVQNIVPSEDFTKLAYIVPPGNNGTDVQGLWVMETLNLPLGFSRDPQRVTDGNLVNASFVWSPDGREILLTTVNGNFLINASTFTSQAQRINVSAKLPELLQNWELEKEKALIAQTRKLPIEMQEVIINKSKSVQFSPDEDMVLFTASSEAKLANDLIKQLPGASTQKQNRDIKVGKTYVYDIKEDRNFLIDDNEEGVQIEGGYSGSETRRLSWYPSSRNLILAEAGKVTIMDYDGHNRQDVFNGAYTSPNAFPTLSFDRLVILTNLGATDSPANLYSLTVK